MVEVVLTFRFGTEFNEARIRQLAESAAGECRDTPGLRSKALLIDAESREAMHVYLWDSEEFARSHFTPDRIELIAALWGVEPSVHFDGVTRTVAIPQATID